jgi:hypothetical protein
MNNDWTEGFASTDDPGLVPEPSVRAAYRYTCGCVVTAIDPFESSGLGTMDLPFPCVTCDRITRANDPRELPVKFLSYVLDREGNTPYDGERFFPSVGAAAEWLVGNAPNPYWGPVPINDPNGYEYEDGWGHTLVLFDHTEEQSKALLAAYYAELELVRRPYLCAEERF